MPALARHPPPDADYRLRARRRPHRGIGMIEALIGLAIAAALLTAVAIGFVASACAISENDEFFRAAQSGRVSLNRILTQVRRGTPANDSTATSLHLLTDRGDDVTYRYDASSKTLSLVTNTIVTDPDYVIARNVSRCSFGTQSGVDPTGHTCISRATVMIAVTIGDNQILYSGSAAPRRSLAY
jgi:hypothetical protein